MNHPENDRHEPFQHPALTLGEWTVLKKLTEGMQPLDIARELGLGMGTVRHRFQCLREKYEVPGISQVKRLVKLVGLPPAPESDA